jgi:hypothetical protein
MREVDAITEAIIDAASKFIAISRDEGPAPQRQQSPSLRVAAPPREPISAESAAGGFN